MPTSALLMAISCVVGTGSIAVLAIVIRKRLWLGGLVYLVLVGVAASALILAFFYHKNTETIRAQYVEFYSAISYGDYGTAYNYMSPEYRRNHTPEDFRSDFLSLFPSFSDLGLTVDGLVEISGDKATLYPWGTSGGWYFGPAYGLIKIEGQWYFSGEHAWYED
jgi:hypothetical protein